MKFKTNIPALLLAALFFTASNGIAVFEHICNTTQTHSFSLFSKPICEMEKPVASCCAKKAALVKKKNCCDHKQFFSKLPVEGFVAKQLQLKPIEKQTGLDFVSPDFHQYSKQIFESHYSGLPPPDNIFQIQSILQPSPVSLQTFRC